MTDAIYDRDLWYRRWQQLMHDHEEAVTERDQAEATMEQVRAVVDRWQRWTNTPIPEGVLSLPLRDVVNELHDALEGDME